MLALFLTALLAASPSALALPNKPPAYAAVTAAPCPTITAITHRCSTCMMPQCMAISTISRTCGCPLVVPTVSVSQACRADGRCDGGCAGTSYVFDTKPPKCLRTSTAAATITTTSSGCVPTVTATTYGGVADGCKFNCSNDFCIMDKFVTLPCGCTTADGVATVTETACATQSPCWNCHVGFPFTTTATGCKSTKGY